MSRSVLASQAVSEALRLRLRAGVALTDPINAIDVAEKLGIQVWFQQLPSAEGLLIRAPHPVILLSSVRPAGRISFTCAHELGHYWLKHKGHIDVVDEGPLLREDSDDEYQANTFASYLLMPKTTVQHGFVCRSVQPEAAPPPTVLTVAHWLGVGYSTLVYHLSYNLKLISDARAKLLLRYSPRQISSHLVGESDQCASAFVVDRAWRARSVDLEVGDVIVMDSPVSTSGKCIHLKGHHNEKVLLVATRPGTGRIDGGGGWATYVRVSRSRFEGRSIFRHLEEADDE